MPHTNNWTSDGLIRAFTGTITGPEIIESNFEMHGDQRFDDINYVINDFSQVDECAVSEEEVQMLPIIDEVATNANDKLKIAIISTHDEITKLAKVYCEMMLQATYDARLFDNFDDAQTWVNSPRDNLSS